jgi:hypothetical protein
MTETNKPLPGTREAVGRGCTCTREGWEWNTVDCLLHDTRPVPTDEELRAMGICPRCGESLDQWGGCGECYQRGVDHDRTMRSLRPSVPAGRTVSSWRQGEWW